MTDLNDRGMNSESKEIQDGIILLPDGEIKDFKAAEKFRIIRAKIEKKTTFSPLGRVYMITAALPGDGKSSIAANLARSFSQTPGGKTLLIDADLRKPTQHRIFSKDKEPGLGDVLTQQATLSNAIKVVNPWLDIITAGVSVTDPPRAIEDPDLAKMVSQFKTKYKYIIIDSPPALLCSETLQLSKIADQIIFVLKALKTDKAAVSEAINLLEKEKIAGIIINEGLEQSTDYGYYGI